MPPVLVTIPNVPIVSVGEDWPAMTGPTTFTRDDLVSAAASADDPGIPRPRLKLTLSQDTHGEAITEPAFGTVTGLRFDEQEQTLYGDYEGVPAWLADVLPVAYPNRSVETYNNVKTSSGKFHKCVVAAVQLLGVEWPGCTVLKDLPLYYGAEKPKTVSINLAGGPMGQEARAAASVAVEDVRRAYYKQLDTQGNFSWWIKSVLLDPNQLVVEDESQGQLYTVNFTPDGDAVKFDDPAPVKVEYVPTDVPASVAASLFADGMLVGRKVAASYRSAEESGRKLTKGGESMTEEQRKAAAKKLGLPEDATEQQISAKLLENVLAAPDPDPGSTTPPATVQSTDIVVEGVAIPALTGGATPPAGTATVPVSGQPNTEPLATAASTGLTVTMDRQRAEQLERDAQLGRDARISQVRSDASALVNSAVEDGRIAPASREAWLSAIFDEKGCRLVESETKVLAGLATGRIPVDERGQGGGGSDVPGQQPQGEPYPESWFPEVSQRKASIAVMQARGIRVFSEKVGA